MKSIIPVMLAGGVGKRLWPISRKSFPKQFCKLIDNKSLFQLTALRFKNHNIIEFLEPIVMTNENFRFIIDSQLSEVNLKFNSIFIEPSAKSTCPAILAASLHAYKNNKMSHVLICPSDHLIQNVKAFQKCILKAVTEMKNNEIITFGIKPNRPETAYGYIKVDKKNSIQELVNVKNFIEKPKLNIAKNMFESEDFLWNSGIFLFSTEFIIEQYKKLQSDIFKNVERSYLTSYKDLNFIRLEQKSWNKNIDISFDYGIMEKSKNVSNISLYSDWVDLGDWNSIWQNYKSTKDQNYLSDNTTAIDCKNSLLNSFDSKTHLVGLGLDNIVAVSTPDAILIADRNKSQNVKDAVDLLKKKKVYQSETSNKDHRPWGWFEILLTYTNYQVKRLFIKPLESISLQKHKYRSEHWIVVSGEAYVIIDNENKIIKQGESIFIPMGFKHRIENKTKDPIVIIEVQTGSYLGEDDIIRYEDKYSRN